MFAILSFLIVFVLVPFLSWFVPMISFPLSVVLVAGYVVPENTSRNKAVNADNNISTGIFKMDQRQTKEERSVQNANSSDSITTTREKEQQTTYQEVPPQRTRRRSFKVPSRELQPPFPDGLNGGRLVTLPTEYYFPSNTAASSLGSSFLLPPREIKVWLPPQYDEFPNDVRFPVLYCHDGQNAIQDSSSWTGYSWRLAGALTRMSERKILQTNHLHAPPIVVLLPCAEDRIAFVPRRHLEYGDISQTFAQSHADFVGLTLKPLIDSMFRTMPEKEHTAAIGTSLGGQASFHLLIRHADIFGKAACMSPAFQPSILSAVATLPSSTLKDKTIYIDNGGDVDDVKVPLLDPFDHLSMNHWWNPGYWWLDSQLQPGIDAMKLALDLKGIKYDYQKFAGGRHNERAWSWRIDKPLFSLYGVKN